MLNDSNYIKSCERIFSSIKGRNTSTGIVLFLYVKDHLMKEEYQEKMNNWVW